jgi:hypothetical protein
MRWFVAAAVAAAVLSGAWWLLAGGDRPISEPYGSYVWFWAVAVGVLVGLEVIAIGLIQRGLGR